MRPNKPADTFAFRSGERVRHWEADTSTFVITRRWLDVDAPEGHNRFYELRDERPLFGQGKIGPLPEGELRKMEEGEGSRA